MEPFHFITPIFEDETDLNIIHTSSVSLIQIASPVTNEVSTVQNSGEDIETFSVLSSHSRNSPLSSFLFSNFIKISWKIFSSLPPLNIFLINSHPIFHSYFFYSIISLDKFQKSSFFQWRTK